MKTEIYHRNQNTVGYSKRETTGVYERLKAIIRRIKLVNKAPKKVLTSKQFNTTTIAHQVREQQDSVIIQSLLLFGTSR